MATAYLPTTPPNVMIGTPPPSIQKRFSSPSSMHLENTNTDVGHSLSPQVLSTNSSASSGSISSPRRILNVHHNPNIPQKHGSVNFNASSISTQRTSSSPHQRIQRSYSTGTDEVILNEMYANRKLESSNPYSSFQVQGLKRATTPTTMSSLASFSTLHSTSVGSASSNTDHQLVIQSTSHRMVNYPTELVRNASSGSSSSYHRTPPSPRYRNHHPPIGTHQSDHKTVSSNASAHSISSSVPPFDSRFLTTRSSNDYIQSSSSVGSSSNYGRSLDRKFEQLNYSPKGPIYKNITNRDMQGSPSSILTTSSHVRSEGSFAEEVNLKTQKVIDDLRRSVEKDRRLTFINHACAEFDHMDTRTHNVELKLGGARVLTHLLRTSKYEDEIRTVCAALEMVHRGSTMSVLKSYQEVGAVLVPDLLKLLERYEENDKIVNSKGTKTTILSITRILLYFSRVSEIRPEIASHTGLFSMIAQVAFSTSLKSDGMEECRVDRMKLLANLSNDDDNKLLILHNNDVMEAICKVSSQDESWLVREYAAASLMDLSSSEKTQRHMAISDKLLTALVKLSHKDEGQVTRGYAVTALQNIAFPKENRLTLVTFNSGAILTLLIVTIVSDHNKITKRRAAGALTNLACEITAVRMANHPMLIGLVSKVFSDDYGADVQHRSSLALGKIGLHVDSSMPCFGKVLDALLAAANCFNSVGIPSVFRTMSRNPLNREAMVRQRGMLETLSNIVTLKEYDDADREKAVKTITSLANENSCRKALCNTWILTALVFVAQWDDRENAVSTHPEVIGRWRSSRDSALLALERLATEASNRQIMARHNGLLAAVAKATERKAKAGSCETAEVKLAKALLMSLVVAM